VRAVGMAARLVVKSAPSALRPMIRRPATAMSIPVSRSRSIRKCGVSSARSLRTAISGTRAVHHPAPPFESVSTTVSSLHPCHALRELRATVIANVTLVFAICRGRTAQRPFWKDLRSAWPRSNVKRGVDEIRFIDVVRVGRKNRIKPSDRTCIIAVIDECGAARRLGSSRRISFGARVWSQLPRPRRSRTLKGITAFLLDLRQRAVAARTAIFGRERWPRIQAMTGATSLAVIAQDYLVDDCG
jgi:hypothetical protein